MSFIVPTSKSGPGVATVAREPIYLFFCVCVLLASRILFYFIFYFFIFEGRNPAVRQSLRWTLNASAEPSAFWFSPDSGRCAGAPL